MIGDHHFKKVEWKGGEDLGVEENEAVIIRFQMKMAKIYGLEFR